MLPGMQYVRGTYRAATSKKAQRTLLQTILLISGSMVLLGLSSVAYILFYRNYLPDQITTIPLHLQYGRAEKPFAIASLHDRNLKDTQDYDVSVSLTVPRSPANLERGNFMLSLRLASFSKSEIRESHTHPDMFLDPTRLIHAEARPALLRYRSQLVSLASRVVFLGYYLLSPAAETEALVVPLAERLSFGTGSGSLPTALMVEVDTGAEAPLRTYAASVTFTAQLRGLRWLMYRYWIASFVVFTSLFWICSVVFMVLAWGVLSLVAAGGRGAVEATPPAGPSMADDFKEEPEEAPPLSEDRLIKKEDSPDYDDEDELASSAPATPGTQISRGPPPSYRSGSTRANKGAPLRYSGGSQAEDTKERADDEERVERIRERLRRDGVETSGFDGEIEGGKLRRRSSQKSVG